MVPVPARVASPLLLPLAAAPAAAEDAIAVTTDELAEASPVAVSLRGNATARVAAGGTGDAFGYAAGASGVGSSYGGYAAASATGRAASLYAAASGAGDAPPPSSPPHGPSPAVSVFDDSPEDCRGRGVSVFGRAQGGHRHVQRLRRVHRARPGRAVPGSAAAPCVSGTPRWRDRAGLRAIPCAPRGDPRRARRASAPRGRRAGP